MTTTYTGPAILIIDETTTDLTATINADGGRWSAELSLPATVDAACRLILPSGDVGRGRITAGSTRLEGDGEPPRLGWR